MESSDISEKDGKQGLVPRNRERKVMDTAITRHPFLSKLTSTPPRPPSLIVHGDADSRYSPAQLQHRQFAADNCCGQDAANPKNGFSSSLSAASSGHLDVLPFCLINLRCTPPLLFFRGRPNSRRHATSSLHPFGAPTDERSKKTLVVAILAHGRALASCLGAGMNRGGRNQYSMLCRYLRYVLVIGIRCACFSQDDTSIYV
ncbi:hypothetical protein HDV63DRAFT_169820 [Trichoderma sp. SZMC 28014]